jgi:hypothetical protein
VQQIHDNIREGLGLQIPQNDTATAEAQLVAMASHRVIWTWREQVSYERGQRYLPFCTHLLVPDIAFQLGPYEPIRTVPLPQQQQTDKTQLQLLPTTTPEATSETLDIVLLLRNDHG